MDYIGPQQGFIIGWWVVGGLAGLTLLLFAVYLLRRRFARDDYGDEGLIFGIASIFGAIITVIAAVFFTFGHYPFESKYWGLYSASGTVTSVTNTFTDGGDYTAQSWIVRLDGDHVPYRLDDPRAVELEEGSHVDLTCQIVYVYSAMDKVSCEIASYDY